MTKEFLNRCFFQTPKQFASSHLAWAEGKKAPGDLAFPITVMAPEALPVLVEWLLG